MATLLREGKTKPGKNSELPDGLYLNSRLLGLANGMEMMPNNLQEVLATMAKEEASVLRLKSQLRTTYLTFCVSIAKAKPRADVLWLPLRNEILHMCAPAGVHINMLIARPSVSS